AFQLVDDLLDYEGAPHQLGKNIGADLREGKPTLPLLMAIARGSASERNLLRHAIVNGEIERLRDIVPIVRSTGALDATPEAARAEARAAQACVADLQAGPAKSALLELCVRSVERSS